MSIYDINTTIMILQASGHINQIPVYTYYNNSDSYYQLASATIHLKDKYLSTATGNSTDIRTLLHYIVDILDKPIVMDFNNHCLSIVLEEIERNVFTFIKQNDTLVMTQSSLYNSIIHSHYTAMPTLPSFNYTPSFTKQHTTPFILPDQHYELKYIDTAVLDQLWKTSPDYVKPRNNYQKLKKIKTLRAPIIEINGNKLTVIKGKYILAYIRDCCMLSNAVAMTNNSAINGMKLGLII
jgi:hypothetical protein